MPERTNGAVLKTVEAQASEGSNPSPSANGALGREWPTRPVESRCRFELQPEPALSFVRHTREVDELVVRAARLDEAGLLADLHLETALAAYRHIFPPDAPKPQPDELRTQWQQWVDEDSVAVLVAEVNRAVAGAVVGSADPLDVTLGHLHRLYVRPVQWGRGAGRRLHDDCLRRLGDEGFAEATLWVLEANTRARRWYERLGWEATGERGSSTHRLASTRSGTGAGCSRSPVGRIPSGCATTRCTAGVRFGEGAEWK